MEYSIVFDVAQSGYRQWWFPALGLIFIMVGIVLVMFRRRMRPVFPWFVLGLSVLWTGDSFVWSLADYRNLSADLRNGRCSVVEGVVSELRQIPPGPPAGYKAETFVVGGHRFQYSDYAVIAGFNQMQSHGGPMRDGQRVRIHYIRDEIARLEIAR